MSPVLRLEDLRTTIDVRDGVVRPVDGVTLEVGRGELLGLVGESGCGKTMTALSIMRLLPPGGRVESGRILLGDDDLAAMTGPELRAVRGKRIGMVFQDPMTSLNPTIPIGKQVTEPLELHERVSRARLRERAVEMLELVGLPDARRRVDDYPHQLSGGMRQRVMIARALVCEPELLIADEPTTALDVTVQHQILELIDDLRRRLGMAVILVTHDLGVVAGRADRVAVMYAGRIAELTGTRSLFGNPRHPYTEALFEALPENAAESGEKLYSIPGLPPDLSDPPAGCRFAPRCRYATAECVATEPPLDGEVKGHEYACFHPVGEPGLTEPSRVVRVHERGGAPADDGSGVESAPLLEVEHLVKDFAVTRGAVLRRKAGTVSAVADVSFTVAAGETFGLVGESGCGKTTVGRSVVGLEEPTSGRIRIAGTELTSLRGKELQRRRRETHLVFQDPYASLDPRMRVGAVLAEPLEIHGVGTRATRARQARELLAEVGLPAGAADRYPHEFSGGQRQRIGLARALALEPKLIVADEPVSALDVSIQAQILNLMNDLRSRHGLTYVFISHDLSVVRYLAQRIGVMYLGKLVEVGPAAEVHGRPRHPYTRGLIDTVPVADPWAEGREGGVTGELPSALDPPSGCRFRTRCPFAQDVCAAEEPVLRTFGDGHQAACHFPLGNSPLEHSPLEHSPLEDDPLEHAETTVYQGENG
ncbi:ABC transporter ATP-binding protein [Amycolatopsis sp. NBC_01480]|uniref:ABC transporter ATP-binding protein n=1 Tax=Amycolatopsis sp. NBC_01480 TaxID=2903562 RepID=UPI002E2E3232|nr:ABC transporter ATP-binding protein [Amycolatopsis sp. NBC_01480]